MQAGLGAQAHWDRGSRCNFYQSQTTTVLYGAIARHPLFYLYATVRNTRALGTPVKASSKAQMRRVKPIMSYCTPQMKPMSRCNTFRFTTSTGAGGALCTPVTDTKAWPWAWPPNALETADTNPRDVLDGVRFSKLTW